MGESIFPEDISFRDKIEASIDKIGEDIFLTDFLFPWQISLARNGLSRSGRNIDEWGGMAGAFRKRLIAAIHKIKHSMFNVSCLEIIPQSMITIPNRKILLDTLSANNVPPESLGDIFHGSDRYFILIDSSFENMQIEKITINPVASIPDTLIPTAKSDISSTVASVRLDSICSTAFKPSRGKLKGLIENGGAMINYNFAYKGGKELAEGDVVSLRGFPRIKLNDIGDVSKKGRTRIKISFLD